MPKTNFYVFPYKSSSQSAKALAEALEAPRIRRERSKFKGASNKMVVNWGSSELPFEITQSCEVLNDPANVKIAGNKLKFFEHQSSFGAESPRLIPWTSDRAYVIEHWFGSGGKVVARTVLTGHSGSGIVVAETPETLPEAPLYTKYVPKDSEWRVHVSLDKVIDVQRKVRDPDREPSDWQVRSHQNGFIYARNSGVPDEDVTTQALRAMKCSGLDFGAVDVIWNRRQQKSYVLEINCAPGLQGSTVNSYAQAFKIYTEEEVTQ